MIQISGERQNIRTFFIFREKKKIISTTCEKGNTLFWTWAGMRKACDFTLFMMHSTISRTYDRCLFSNWVGRHHISARYFSQIMQKFPAEYAWV